MSITSRISALLPTLFAGTNFVLHAAGWLEGGLIASPERRIQSAMSLLK